MLRKDPLQQLFRSLSRPPGTTSICAPVGRWGSLRTLVSSAISIRLPRWGLQGDEVPSLLLKTRHFSWAPPGLSRAEKKSHNNPGFSDKVCFSLQLGCYCLDFHKYSGRCWVWHSKGDSPTHKKLVFFWVRHRWQFWKAEFTGSPDKWSCSPAVLPSPGHRGKYPN